MLSACLVQDLLTRSPWRDAVPFAGVRIKGARIAGDIDLVNAKLIRPIEIRASRIEGEIKLLHARTDSLILLDGSLIDRDFNAGSLHSESALSLANGAVFKSVVNLNGAKIDGHVNMTGAIFDGTLYADSLQAGGRLFMHEASYAHEVKMLFAHLGGGLPPWRVSIFRARQLPGTWGSATKARAPSGQEGAGNLA